MPTLNRRWFTAVTLLPVLLGAPPAATAGVVPLLDLHAGLGYWQPAPAGDVASDGDRFDVEDDLDFGRNSTNLFRLGVEHPVPWLPNVRLSHLSLRDSANSTVTGTRTFGPVTFRQDEDVRSEYDLAITDATFYYRPLDNWIALDLGMTVRYMEIDVEIESRESGEREEAGGSFVIPMAHLGLRGDLPLTGVYGTAEIDAISVSGNSLRDLRAGVGWESPRVFGIEAGYRQMALDIDDADDLEADMDFSGAYVQANLRF